MFGYELNLILYSVPWFALAGWVANPTEPAGRTKLVLSVFWGAVASLAFFWALSVIGSGFPLNIVGIVVAWPIAAAAAVSPFIAVWRITRRLMARRAARS